MSKNITPEDIAARKSCRRCSGTGNSGHFADHGHCYGCNGLGYIPGAAEEAKNKAATKAREIAARTAEVAHARENVEKATSGWARRSAEANLRRSEEVLAFWKAQ